MKNKQNPAITAPPDSHETDPRLAPILATRSTVEVTAIKRAWHLAETALHGRQQASGESRINHPLAVAGILQELRLDHESLIAALLHDIVEDADIDIGIEAIRDDFGNVVADLVDGVARMAAISEYSDSVFARMDEQRQLERLKKLLLVMAQDARVVLIKLADRLHDMRTLRQLDAPERQRIARETLKIYAPLASRLGIAHFKWEMEDLALRELEPTTYAQIAGHLNERRTARERDVKRIVTTLDSQLENSGVKAEITGRVKHIYGIWLKMQAKNLGFDKIFDVRAVRILVDSLADCYTALSMIHSLWNLVPNEFDDYIANPKPNGYQSLHTAVIGPRGNTLEVQIRTYDMHAHAEYGVAAHWRYKEGTTTGDDGAMEAKVSWLRQIIDVKDTAEGPRDFLDRFGAEMLTDRVYVLTPRGEVLDLPDGATPLDFAYLIHTDVGHRCRGAKANGIMVQLTYRLRSGDQISILTTRNGTPSRDWLSPHLGYLHTPRARAKVRHWFKEQDHEKNMLAGQEMFQRELRRLGIENPDREKLLSRFNYKRFKDLLAGIGHGEVSGAQLATALQHIQPVLPAAPVSEPRRRNKKKSGAGILVQGVGNLLTQFARCCRPVPEEPITAFITRGRGVSIHRADCPNMLHLDEEQRTRLIEVSWDSSDSGTYAADILVIAYDRKGMLHDITTVLAGASVYVSTMDTRGAARGEVGTIKMTVEVSDLGHLSRVLDQLSQLRNVIEARRVG